jgi:hypothetical protein
MVFHSSNTWVGAGKDYVKTNTSHKTTNKVVSGLEFVFMRNLCVESLNQQKVRYGSGTFSGKFLLGSPIILELINSRNHIGNEFTDKVTIGPGLVISNQSIGVATKANGFLGVDGLLG